MFKFISTVVLAAMLTLSGCTSVPSTAHTDPTVKITYQNKLGSGVHLYDGFILTANHVIEGMEEIKVTKQNGKTNIATVIWTDPDKDLALIKINDENDLQDREVSCAIPQIADRIEAVGNPLTVEFIHTWGRIAGTPRKFGPWEIVSPTDITILPGMSGGPTYDEQGRVIGINVGMATWQMGGTGLTFVVPGNALCEAIAEHGN